MQWFRIFWFMALLVASGRGYSQPASGAIDSLFKAAVANGFSGEILVARQGRVIYHVSAGYRHFEDNTPLKKGDIYELASVSKQFTGMIITMLAQKGLLNINDPLERYIDLPYQGITIRHLLNHTSGLPDYQAIMDQYWDKSKVAGNPDIISYLNKYAPPALFPPGQQYSYSNTGYVMLASVAEKVTGRDFIALMRDWIFRPLNMKRTDIRTLEEKAAEKRFAAGHLKDSTGRFVNANRFHSSDYTVWLGNRKGPGRVSGTAKDLLKWDKALYTRKLVNQYWLDQAFTPGVNTLGQSVGYGFGWDIDTARDGSKMVKHNGDNPGYKTQIVRMLGNRSTLILLCNNAWPAFAALVKALADRLQP